MRCGAADGLASNGVVGHEFEQKQSYRFSHIFLALYAWVGLEAMNQKLRLGVDLDGDDSQNRTNPRRW